MVGPLSGRQMRRRPMWQLCTHVTLSRTITATDVTLEDDEQMNTPYLQLSLEDSVQYRN